MKLQPIGSNQNVLTLNDGTEILFSYDTPVACHLSGVGYQKTDKKWSNTTSKHINKWIDNCTAESMPQSYFDDLIK